MKRAQRLRGSKTDPKTYALKLISYRSRSRKEIRERLKRKGFNDDEVDNTVRLLEESGLIKDEALVPGLLRYATERRYLGTRGVEAFLYKRGIEKELITRTLTGYTIDMEKEAARSLAEKKLITLKSHPEDVKKRRLLGALKRRGFSYDIIRSVIQSI